jgi:hypothetical protein
MGLFSTYQLVWCSSVLLKSLNRYIIVFWRKCVHSAIIIIKSVLRYYVLLICVYVCFCRSI